MKRIITILVCGSLLSSCGDDAIDTPETYSFTRDSQSTVSFSGQTTRILMAEELVSASNTVGTELNTLLDMFENQGRNGEDVSPFSTQELNDATKSIASKVAASKDFFSANTVESATIKADFTTWMTNQVNDVHPNNGDLATPGVPGLILDGTSTRYINGQGLEYNQMIAKSLIGALMADQMLNNYLSTAVLDESTNREDNDNGVVAEGKSYTTMEHKWDEAYGYLYGTSANVQNPVATVGSDDSFLNKYLGRVEGDADFAGISQQVFDAFKLGRAAITEGDYDERDKQADIIKEAISKVIGVRAVYYLQQGKNALANDDFGGAFHDLSEGLGFIYSLRFTRKTGSEDSYFTYDEVASYISDLTSGNGFWDLDAATIDTISEAIASKYDFSVAEAAE